MNSAPKILFCVLNWGLGHATRSSRMISHLLDSGAEIVIASDGPALHYLSTRFPEIHCVQLPGYNIQYPKRKALFSIKMGLQVPGILRTIEAEHQFVNKLHKKEQFDLVISDNRYGCYIPSLRNYFIGHQLNIQAGSFSSVLHRLHCKRLNRFQEVWIPDYADSRLSGRLSNRFLCSVPQRFIGPLSRFDLRPASTAQDHFILGIVSGPEPQRSIFEQALRQWMRKYHLPGVILAGKPDEAVRPDKNEQLQILPHCSDEEFRELVDRASLIVCRPGYSTLMDLWMFNKSALLVPTPGQTEQRYLAEHWAQNFGFDTVSQKKLISISPEEVQSVPFHEEVELSMELPGF